MQRSVSGNQSVASIVDVPRRCGYDDAFFSCSTLINGCTNVFVLSDPSKVRRVVVFVAFHVGQLSDSFSPFILQIGNVMNDGKKYKTGKADSGVPKVVGTEKEKPAEKRSVIEAVVPLAWGGGRSFADVLKKEEAADQRTSS